MISLALKKFFLPVLLPYWFACLQLKEAFRCRFHNNTRVLWHHEWHLNSITSWQSLGGGLSGVSVRARFTADGPSSAYSGTLSKHTCHATHVKLVWLMDCWVFTNSHFTQSRDSPGNFYLLTRQAWDATDTIIDWFACTLVSLHGTLLRQQV
jgi:hypothetical protein